MKKPLSFGQLARKLRRRSDQTAFELAQVLGRHGTAVCQVETGQVLPYRPDEIVKFVEAVGSPESLPELVRLAAAERKKFEFPYPDEPELQRLFTALACRHAQGQLTARVAEAALAALRDQDGSAWK